MDLAYIDQARRDYRRPLLQPGGLDAAILHYPESVTRGHSRNFREVIEGGRGRCGPFERTRIPRISAGALARGQAPIDIEQQGKERKRDDVRIPGFPLVPEVPA